MPPGHAVQDEEDDNNDDDRDYGDDMACPAVHGDDDNDEMMM